MLPLAPLLAALSATPPPDSAVRAEPPPPEPVLETAVLAGMGLAGGHLVGGMDFSILLTQDIGMLELGLEADLILLTSRLFGAGLVAGVRVGDDVSFRVLGAGGVHVFNGIYADRLTGDPGMSDTLPYVGCRWLFGYRVRVSNPRRRPTIGVLAALDYDLFREQATYQGGPPQYATVTRERGQLTYRALFLAGWERDLTPY
jgi:hypothetical protein